MGIEKVLKIGIAVTNLDKAVKLFTEVLGLEPGEMGTYEPLGMRFALCQLGDVTFELMEPITPGGTIAKFIETHGEGLQHISLEVSNIEEVMSQLKANGIQLVQETPRREELGFWGAKFAFVHPRSLHGVLLQLVEPL